MLSSIITITHNFSLGICLKNFFHAKFMLNEYRDFFSLTEQQTKHFYVFHTKQKMKSITMEGRNYVKTV